MRHVMIGLVVVMVIAACAREWWLIVTGRTAPRVSEAPYVETGINPVPQAATAR